MEKDPFPLPVLFLFPLSIPIYSCAFLGRFFSLSFGLLLLFLHCVRCERGTFRLRSSPFLPGRDVKRSPLTKTLFVCSVPLFFPLVTRIGKTFSLVLDNGKEPYFYLCRSSPLLTWRKLITGPLFFLLLYDPSR